MKEETILVTSCPSNLRVYLDDDEVKYTPFTCPVDYEHHSLTMGFERREFFFNDNQKDIAIEPGLEQVIRNAMKTYNGNLTLVAKALKISRPTLYRRLKEYGI